jgi:hypothetical protein
MLSGIVDNGSPLTVAGAASALLQPGIHAKCRTPVAAAPNSLLAGSRRHLCRVGNQSSGACLVNATMSAAGRDADFGKASGILATVGRAGMKGTTIAALALSISLAACTTSNNSDSLSYTADRGVDTQLYPSSYRTELLAFLRTYLNDPQGVRGAAIAQPVQRMVGGRLRYVACLRYSARETDGSQGPSRIRAALFVDGRLDRLIEEGKDICENVTFAPFPEMEKLTR